MNIQLGASTLCWQNRKNPQSSLEKCLREISLIGYRGVELTGGFSNEKECVLSLLKRKKLRCIGKGLSLEILKKGFEEAFEELRKHVAFLKNFGSDVVIVTECSGAVYSQKDTPLSKRPKITKETEWRRLCEALEEMAHYIASQGMCSAYHPHMGSVIQGGEEISRLMEDTETLGLLLDTGHLTFAQENPIDILRKHIQRVSHVHCCSVRLSILNQVMKEDWSFFRSITEGVFTVPGDREFSGAPENVDAQEIMSLLMQGGYNGWVVVEAEPGWMGGDPFYDAQLGFETLHSCLTQAEFYCEKVSITSPLEEMAR